MVCMTVQHHDRHLLDTFWFPVDFGIVCECPLKSSLFISGLFIFWRVFDYLRKKCLHERKPNLRKCFRGRKILFCAKLPTMSLYKASSVHIRKEVKLNDHINIFSGITVKLFFRRHFCCPENWFKE